MATITIEIPEEILSEFGTTPEERSRFALEALVIEAHRRDIIGDRRAAAALGLQIMKFYDFLQDRGMPMGHSNDVGAYVNGRKASKKCLLSE